VSLVVVGVVAVLVAVVVFVAAKPYIAAFASAYKHKTKIL